MKKAAAQPTTKSPRGKDQFSLGTLAFDLFDTTWRIATPVVLLAIAGIFIDIKIHTKPWFTLIGTVIGFIIAGVLLKKQLATIENREDKE